ncbi:MAG: glycyl-radical enzyme activating protein [bacterium]
MTGTIFDIKHYALHDGPGIRTTVFLKGCPLGCWWCHNPESRSGEIVTFRKKEKVSGREIVKEAVAGKKITVNELMEELEKDALLYEESGGGITLSGGEPMQQFRFSLKLLKVLKKKGYHTCMDTTGYTRQKELERVAVYTDLFLYDLKHFDDNMHKKYTGVSNKIILENLRLLDRLGKTIEIRYPLIPGMNDDEADLLRMLAFLQKLSRPYPVTILPYHKIGSHKYERFNLEYKMEGIEEPSADHIDEIKEMIIKNGFEATIGG